jgi:hypothetical protein
LELLSCKLVSTRGSKKKCEDSYLARRKLKGKKG